MKLTTMSALATLIATCLLTCAAGCQSSDRSAGGYVHSEKDVERLSSRQVSDAQLSLARSLEQQGETARAMEAYRETVQKNPRLHVAWWRMAVLHDRQGNIGESEEMYRKALKGDPKNPDIHCDYGYSLYLQRRWAESEEHLRRAVALKSSHRRAHNNLGLLLAQTDRRYESLSEFHKAGIPEDEAHANLAFVMTLNQQWDQAREEYELALAVNPGSAVAKDGLRSLTDIVAKADAMEMDVVPVTYQVPNAD